MTSLIIAKTSKVTATDHHRSNGNSTAFLTVSIDVSLRRRRIPRWTKSVFGVQADVGQVHVQSLVVADSMAIRSNFEPMRLHS